MQLYNFCQSYVLKRMESAQQAIEITQAAANEETKSSAGDKYETGRAMMQLEMEKHIIQRAEALKLKQTLDQLSIDTQHSTAQLGSLVITSQGNFFLSISAGQFVIEDLSYIAISLSSPIGMKLKSSKVNDSFTFNDRIFLVTNIY
jgi:transcription elongation GreA/GreB family factor